MKKVLKALAAGALLASIATVASCGGKTTTTPAGSTPAGSTPVVSTPAGSTPVVSMPVSTDPNNLDVSINYKNGTENYGVTFQMAEAETGLDGKLLSKGNLLPAWAEFGNKLNLNIRDAANYAATLKEEWEGYLNEGFVTADKNKIDVIMCSTNETTVAANSGKLWSINELMAAGKLPNFKKWLDEKAGGVDGSIFSSMKAANGSVYYTPYFDGLNNVEKMFIMNVDMVAKLLDVENANYDTTEAKTSNFKEQVRLMNNEKITVSKNGVAQEITVNYTADQNVIAQQNALQVKNGQTYTQTLINYIDEVYGEYIGEGKLYAKRSEIFTSEQACYNADDLVALWRCAVNNPSYLTDGAETEVWAVAPRAIAANRQRQILELAQIWGVRGLSAEKDKLFFDAEGELQDGRTKQSTYDAINLLHELHEEGLFPEDYALSENTSSDSFRKEGMRKGKLLSIYDYNAGSTAFNSDADSTSKTANMQAILPPVVQWDDPIDSPYNNFFRFTEDNRALKSGGWCIPKDTDNLDGACAIVDFMFCDEGADIQDYGPNTTDYRAAVTTYDNNGNRVETNDGALLDIGGQKVVKMSENVTKNAKFIAGWNNFCRKYIGSTQGIGHQRSDGVDYQATVSAKGQEGLAKLNSAMAAGALVLATTDKTGFFASVPSSFALTTAQTDAINNNSACKVMSELWKESKNVTCGYTYWIMGGADDENVKTLIGGTVSDLYASFAEIDSVYISAYRNALLKTE